ncbi:MAG TPA: TetR/AcrR family transcriptional regulator [Sphingomicrobium sp.]|nr:TetR/AcrR family transcriptional regulator [Sphingomicrobium sp.]
MARTRGPLAAPGSAKSPRARKPSPTAFGESGNGKAPRTPRGERTRKKILDAALLEFGDHGFAESSIVGITRRARVALGTFYTYFDSKEEVFRTLVRGLSEEIRICVAPSLEQATDGLDAERRALIAFLEFVETHEQVYRLIDEAETVDPEGFRRHYEVTAARIAARLAAATDRGELRSDPSPIGNEAIAWAVMGANVFLGLRFGVWGKAPPEEVAGVMNRLLRNGLKR